ncbi:hypothetical protein NKDENANG_03974 [Candidatus Entotheonellaceae bacterium PAL068K]
MTPSPENRTGEFPRIRLCANRLGCHGLAFVNLPVAIHMDEYET